MDTMDNINTWYLVNAVLKHHDILKEGNYDDVRNELIRLQKKDPATASNLYMTQHMPPKNESSSFLDLEF